MVNRYDKKNLIFSGDAVSAKKNYKNKISLKTLTLKYRYKKNL